MRELNRNRDLPTIKQKRGTWRRFAKLLLKCPLPWVWIALYLAFDLGVVNLGISETDYMAQLLAGDISATLLIKLIGVIVINIFATSLSVFIDQITRARIDRNMRTALLSKVVRLPMSYYKDENPRDAVYRVASCASIISGALTFAIIPTIISAYTAVMVFGKVFTYDWRLSIILIAFIPFNFLIGIIFGRLNFSVSSRSADVGSELTQKLAELVTNIPLVKAFAKEKEETERGKELNGRLYKIGIYSSWLLQFRHLSETALSLIKSVIMVTVGYMLLRGGEITTRAWVAFFMFSSTFSGAISNFVMYWANLKGTLGGGEKVAEIMDAPEEDVSGEACRDLTGDIVLSDVHFAYEGSDPTLKGVSCTFRDGCVTALLGVSGCGKTTLVNLLLRLYTPQEGTICAGGTPVHSYALDEYREQFVMVPQNGILFSGTVRENVCYGNGAVSEEAFVEALKNAGAYEFVQSLPKGADTWLEEYGHNLSGGQKQRLQLARALLSNAHYIILDEPIAAMDSIAVAEFMEILRRVAKGRCMIVIAHTAAVLRAADRVVVIEDGVVSTEGETAEAVKTNRFLQAFAGEEAAV